MATETQQPDRFYVVIPCDIRDLLVPKHCEAFGLYTRLLDAVTCEVPYEGKKFGLVLGGTSMSQADWAKRLHTTRSSFQRGLSILKQEKLIVTHRGQYDTQIGITDSIKRTRQHATISQYPWLLDPSDASDVTQLDRKPDAPQAKHLCPRTKQLRPGVEQLQSPENLQVAEDTMTWEEVGVPDKKVDRKAEKRTTHSLLSENFTTTDAHRALAAQVALDLDFVLQKFKVYHRAAGTKCADWEAKFTSWLLNEKPGSSPVQRVEMVDAVEEFRKQTIRRAEA